MARYLLDTSVLIQAKKDYYTFELCPGFWTWIKKAHEAKCVFSIRPVLEEIAEKDDGLKTWAKQQPATFFQRMDQSAAEHLRTVTAWVQNGDFKPEAKTSFLRGADTQLIAFAMANKLTVVTHEVHKEGERKKVKIPTVCKALEVPCVRTFQMLTEQKAQFILNQADGA